MEKEIHYEFSKNQMRKLNKWKRDNNLDFGDTGTVEGGAFTYCFTPTSLGLMIIVKHVFGKEINLTTKDDFLG